jgi:ParB family chromosome partitioning protein
MSITTIPLSKLHLSPLNVRQTGAADDTSDLEASIPVHGLLAHLIVHKIGKPRGHFGVLAGGRRLRAMQRLRDRGQMDAETPIDCEIREADDSTSTEISVIENTGRVALPPVTEFRAYARLAEEGADEAAIAQRFSTTVLQVRQRMRLGQLHPTILDALEQRVITLDAAKAYASVSDVSLQRRVFERQEAVGTHHDHAIRARYRAETSDQAIEEMIELVGLEEYLAAGGKADDDLFLPHAMPRILTPDLLRDLYAAKLESETAALCLPDNVMLQLGTDDVGERVVVGALLTDEQQARREELETRGDAITERLEAIAEWDQEGPIDRLVAIAGASQDEVNNLQSELKRVERESESILDQARGYPDGPVIALAIIDEGRLLVTEYARPLGWSPHTELDDDQDDDGVANTGSAARLPNLAAITPTPPAATIVPKVVNAFEQDRKYKSGVQPEEAARAEHGLSKDGTEAMRSIRRQTLAAMMLGDVSAQRTAADYLTFTLARGMLANLPAYEFGVNSLPRHEYDPIQAKEDQAGHSGATDWQAVAEQLRGRDWMTEKSVTKAFQRFTSAPAVDKTLAAAWVATIMLSRSLNAPGFQAGMHDMLAWEIAHDRSDAEVRSYWTPDERFFARLPKGRRLDAINAVDPALAAQVGNLGNADLTAAAAAIMAATPAAIGKYKMTPAMCDRAVTWLPDYMRFREPDRWPTLAERFAAEAEAAAGITQVAA